MKNMMKVFGILAMVAVIGVMTACPNDPGPSEPNYKAIAQNQISFISGVYELIIVKTAKERAAGGAEVFVPVNGDDYKLLKSNNLISSGKVSVSGDTYTFAVGGDSNKEFNATLTGGNMLFDDDIKLNDGTTIGKMTLGTMAWGPAGKWKGTGTHNEPGYGAFPWEAIITVTGDFSGGTWKWDLTIYNPGKKGIQDTDSSEGDYTANGNTFVASSDSYTVATAYMINSNKMSVTVFDYFGTTTTATFTRQP